MITGAIGMGLGLLSIIILPEPQHPCTVVFDEVDDSASNSNELKDDEV
jgi:hypothetical protein